MNLVGHPSSRHRPRGSCAGKAKIRDRALPARAQIRGCVPRWRHRRGLECRANQGNRAVREMLPDLRARWKWTRPTACCRKNPVILLDNFCGGAAQTVQRRDSRATVMHGVIRWAPSLNGLRRNRGGLPGGRRLTRACSTSADGEAAPAPIEAAPDRVSAVAHDSSVVTRSRIAVGGWDFPWTTEETPVMGLSTTTQSAAGEHWLP